MEVSDNKLKRKVGPDHSQVFKEINTKTIMKLVKHVEQKTTFDDLPPELLCEIFSWLPFTAIVRIRCTCKMWYNLMADPRILATQLSRPSQTTVGHLVSNSNEIYYVEKVGSNVCCLGPRLQNYPDLYDHSSGGLAVTQIFSPKRRYYYYVENPFIGERIEVPDDQLPCISYGFGYSPSTNEYKLVTLGSSRPSLTVSVFTLGSGHWRRIAHVPFYPQNTHPVECDGVIFWKISQYQKLTDMNGLFMSFDVTSECIRTWQGPELEKEINRDEIRVGKIGKFAACVLGIWTNNLQIWVLRDMTKDVWVKEHNIFSGISPPLVFVQRICSGSWITNDVSFGRDNESYISYYRYYSVKDYDNGDSEVVKCPLRGGGGVARGSSACWKPGVSIKINRTR